jgi:hypothetical protein
LQGVSVAFVVSPTSDVVRNVDRVIPRNSGISISDNELHAVEGHFKANDESANPEQGDANDVSINVYFHVISQRWNTRRRRYSVVWMSFIVLRALSSVDFVLISVDRFVNAEP